MMKSWLTLIVLLALSLAGSSQIMEDDWGDEPDYSRVQAQRVAYITQRLQLTPQEAQQFWPLYNQFEQERREIRRRYRPAKPMDELTEAEAQQLISRQLELEKALLDLRSRYSKQFLRVLPAKKIVLFPRADREFKRDLLRQLRQRRGRG